MFLSIHHSSSPRSNVMREARTLAAILVLTIFLGSAPAKDNLPADLDLVPRDAAGFVHIRLTDLWQSDWLKDMRLLVDRAGPEAWKMFQKKCPLDPETLERMTVILLTPQTLANPFPAVDPEAMSAVVVLTTKKPYDRLALMQGLAAREKIYRNNVYYFNEEYWSGIVLVDERTFLIGSEDALVRYFEVSKRPGRSGPLEGALTEAAGKHQVVVGMNPQLLGKEKEYQALPAPMHKLLAAQSGIVTFDLDKGIHLGLRFNFADEDKARAGETGLRDTLELGRQGLAFPIAELENMLKGTERASSDDIAGNFSMLVALGFLREVDTILKEAPVQRQGQAVKLAVDYKRLESSQMLFVFSLFSVGRYASSTFDFIDEKFRDGKDPVEEHLKTLADALEKYHAKHGSYPPAALCDGEGRPVLSWRVALLPYLGEEALYNEFKLDEPWDSLHNKRLLKKLPKALQPVEHRRRSSRLKTMTQVFTGEKTVFDGKKGVRKTDVDKQTILLAYLPAEANVYWTKPADFSYAAEKPLSALFGKHGHERIKVMLQDGSFRNIDKNTDEKALRGLIERRGNKPPKE
jgi:hypothetical protein